MRKLASIIAASTLLFAGATRADRDGTVQRESFATSAVAKGAAVAPSGSLSGGTLRLDPLLPGGGGVSASAQLLLFGSIGQPGVTTSYGAQLILRPGFWTPVDALAADHLFYDGFESE